MDNVQDTNEQQTTNVEKLDTVQSENTQSTESQESVNKQKETNDNTESSSMSSVNTSEYSSPKTADVDLTKLLEQVSVVVEDLTILVEEIKECDRQIDGPNQTYSRVHELITKLRVLLSK